MGHIWTRVAGPNKSPGYLRENIRIIDGNETDVVSGPCDFAD